MEKYISIQNLIDAENEAVQEYNGLVDSINYELEALDCLMIAKKSGMVRSVVYEYDFNMRKNKIENYLDKSKELEKEIAELRMNLKTVLLPYV